MPGLRKQTEFPARAPHRYRLLVDGGAIFPELLSAIAQARQRVLLEMYLWTSGRLSTLFVDALCAAAGRGVTVSVLIDDFGCRGLGEADRRRLARHGVRLAVHNPVTLQRVYYALQRNHRKLLAVDGRVAFVGGIGLTDDFDPGSRGDAAWHDLMLAIEGPCVADWERLFAATWRCWHSAPIDLDGAGPVAAKRPDGRVLGSSRVGGQVVMRALIAAAVKSRRRVWLTTAYFVPTRRLRQALGRAARAGVDVRLLLPGPDTDVPGVRHAGRRFHGRLLNAGVRIFEYQPRCLHAKFAVCDDWATVGSSNFDHWTLRWNLEANQEVLDAATADALAALFAADLLQCREHTLQAWQQRGWFVRLQERVYGAIDAALVRLDHIRALRRRLHSPTGYQRSA